MSDAQVAGLQALRQSGGAVLVVEREPLVGGVRERRCCHHHGTHRQQRANNASRHHLPLPAGQVRRQPRAARRRQESAGEREDLEATVKGNDAGGGLPKDHVCDGAGAGEHADAALAPARELGDGVGHVSAAADLQEVAAQRARAVADDEDGGLRLIFGTRGATSRPPRRRHHGAFLLFALRGGAIFVNHCRFRRCLEQSSERVGRSQDDHLREKKMWREGAGIIEPVHVRVIVRGML